MASDGYDCPECSRFQFCDAHKAQALAAALPLDNGLCPGCNTDMCSDPVECARGVVVSLRSENARLKEAIVAAQSALQQDHERESKECASDLAGTGHDHARMRRIGAAMKILDSALGGDRPPRPPTARLAAVEKLVGEWRGRHAEDPLDPTSHWNTAADELERALKGENDA